MINVTKAYDGQGAFKNGMHDCAAGVRAEHNLYRQGRLNRALWRAGHLFQRLTHLGHVNQLVPCAICRHRHDPEHMLVLVTPEPLICKHCAARAAGDQP